MTTTTDRPAPHNKGKKMSDAQRKKVSEGMKKSYAERKKKYGAHKGRGLEKWTPAQHKKFRATMKAKREEKQATKKTNGHGNGAMHQMIPLDAIPERGTKPPRYHAQPRRSFIPQDNHELATDLLRIAVVLLKGKP